jgi:hypothetical protein
MEMPISAFVRMLKGHGMALVKAATPKQDNTMAKHLSNWVRLLCSPHGTEKPNIELRISREKRPKGQSLAHGM